MKHKQNLLKIVLVLAICLTMLLCIGCQKPVEPDPSEPTHAGHTHSFSKAWKHDDTNHWKSCVCGAKDSVAAHTDTDGNLKCDTCNRTVEAAEEPAGALATAEQMKNVTVTKTASAGGALTAHPGGNITFTIAITNNNTADISVNVTDTIPGDTAFVSGCSQVSGSSLTWESQNVKAGATKEISYTVKTNYTVAQVRSSGLDKPIVIKGTAAKVMDKATAVPADIFVLETFNATDRRRIEMAIDALVTANTAAYTADMQPFNGMVLATMMYKVGFSAGLEMPTNLTEVLNLIYDTEHGTGDLRHRVAPTLFGGAAVPAAQDSLFRGKRTTKVQLSDLISGDLIVTEKGKTTKLYIFDGIKLVELGTTQVDMAVSTESVLANLPSTDRFAVLRPSINLNTHFSLENGQYFNDADKEEYTDLEKAMVKTAETFLLRGDRLQYSGDSIGKSIDRAQSAVFQPEDYTVDQYGYMNSAYFTRDVHWATYGVVSTAKCTDGSYRNFSTIGWILGCSAYEWDPVEFKGGNKSSIFYYECPSQEVDGQVVYNVSEAEKKEMMDKFISLLRPGDVITYGALSGNEGHAMLYVGNGLIIHATGDDYSKDNKTDSHEAAICFMNVTELFDQENHPEQYVFNKARFSINRPQKMRSASVTENTKSRLDLFGVIGEKISSTAMGKTVNSGDEITYTFYIYNTNNTAKKVTVFDVLSEHVTFVSATDGGKTENGNITWSLEIPADTRITLSYTVKVKDNVPAYTAIDGTKATINGVAHRCYNTYVVNTLTAAEQQKLIDAVNTVKGMDVAGLNGVQLANLIYKTAFGVDNIFGENVTDFGLLFNGNGTENVGVFGDTAAWANSAFVIIKDSNTSKGAMMAAPGMFGGAYTFNGYTKYNGNTVNEPYSRYASVNGGILRSRYYYEKDLVAGDIFLMKSSSKNYLYLYVGNDTFVSLGEDLEVFTETSVSALFQYAPADTWRYHVVLRPSMVLDI